MSLQIGEPPKRETVKPADDEKLTFDVQIGCCTFAAGCKVQTFLDALSRHNLELAKNEKKIDRLRGQLQNCVDHLHYVKSYFHSHAGTKLDKVIDSANKALYETLNH